GLAGLGLWLQIGLLLDRADRLVVGRDLDLGGLRLGFERDLLVDGLPADVVGARARERLVRRQAAVARARQRGARAAPAGGEDRRAAAALLLLLVAALLLLGGELGLRADVD